MNTIVYLLYGSRREYQLELTYSVLSVVDRAAERGSDLRIALITDSANQRPDLPVENVVFSQSEYADWTGNGQYKHAAKIHALSKALNLFKGKVALLDTDTYFSVCPLRLFERFGPGKSVMHAYEGTLGSDRYLRPILQKLDKLPLSYQVSRETRLFNSGVIGLDYSDRHLMDDVRSLTGRLYSIYPAFNTEQFAFSIALDKRTSLAECPDLIRHYYGYLRGFIHSQIAELFPEFSVERFRHHLREFPGLNGYPKKRGFDQLKARLKAILRRERDDYRFAYLASLSALSCARRSPVHADIWARIAVDVLRQNEFLIAAVERDFREMKRLEGRFWASEDTKNTWALFWREIADARRRGQVRATATSYVV